jgi:hypothetical protein
MSARPGSYHAHRRATTRTARYELLDTVEQLADALDDARDKLADEAGSASRTSRPPRRRSPPNCPKRPD